MNNEGLPIIYKVTYSVLGGEPEQTVVVLDPTGWPEPEESMHPMSGARN